ncbi:MAG: glycoside hydrolase family 65 protein [Anaerolineae bacterium]|nr:glycoside hydrolase family 65 protein [Anaerolineae bacterium]
MAIPITPEVRSWHVVEANFFLEKQHHSETILTVGNGYLGTRGTFAEGYPGELPATLIHGVFNHHPDDLVPDLVNAPAWFAVTITVDGHTFRLDQGAVLGFRQVLNMKTGVLRREVLWQSPAEHVVRLTFERFASMDDQHLLAQRITITALEPVAHLICSAHLDDARARNMIFVPDEGVKLVLHWATVQTEADGARAWWDAKTAQSSYGVRFGQYVSLDADVVLEPVGGTSPGSRFETGLGVGESVALTRLVAVATSRDTDDLPAFVAQKLDHADTQGYDALKAAHEAAWRAIWDDMDIVIEGDEYAQRAIRFTTYHITIAAPHHDERVSIGAKTLSGSGYKGHVFWDTELFVLPPFTITQPEVARALLMYRYHNLAGARAKAREAGYEGAMFPWESTDTGEETTPRWSYPDEHGNRIRIWTGDNEQHISSDISYAVWQYWQWTGDDDFLRDYGAEIILDTAVFWTSRVEWNAEAERYELSQQIGPDEFHENVNNSVYTNRLVVWHLECAFAVLAWLAQHAPDQARTLAGRLDLHDQRFARWRDIIEKMYIPRDEEREVYLQFDGFFEMDQIDVQAYEPRVKNMDVILGHERTQRTQVLKQADVIMLIALLGPALGTQEELIRNWDAYSPRTAHDSSLSAAIHAWVAARLGLIEVAYGFFMQSAGLDLENNKGNVRDGIHAAASGALWQAIVFGFAGLHLDADGNWQVDPHLPPWWKSVSFSFYHRGERHRVTIA